MVVPYRGLPQLRDGLIAGDVGYRPDPVEPPADGNVLICCSRPQGDIVHRSLTRVPSGAVVSNLACARIGILGLSRPSRPFSRPRLANEIAGERGRIIRQVRAVERWWQAMAIAARFQGIRSTHCAREGPGSKGSPKYWVSRATFPSTELHDAHRVRRRPS